MPVLIDGNNLQPAAWSGEPQRPVGRMMMCRFLGEWARRFGHRVRVVFDGVEPHTAVAEQIADPDIQVRYSGPDETADDVLMRLIRDDSAPRRLLVVSSDRQIARAARRRRAESIRSDGFWGRVQRDLSRPRTQPAEPPEKRRGASCEQTQQWLAELGFDPPAESPEEH
jgi:predicted RNA-binding protein with PIN domain